MKQVLQNLRNGQTLVEDVPAPGLGRNSVLIQTRRSLISAGTERMLVEFGKASLLAKARSQPDKVKQVLDKIKTDGVMPTLEAVFNRLDEPLPLGYCNAGVVLEVGPGVTDFKPGDRVISNGPHAEVVAVPQTLCAKIPDDVSDESAAFAVLCSIGLQGVRLAQPTLGEKFVVYGMGLIGLVTVQLLRASGCEVLGVDINEQRLEMARRYGAQTVNVAAGGEPVAAVTAWTGGKGADGVLITASAKTDEIAHKSAEMCRKRGRIVLVGVVGLNLRRSDFYEKELSFQVSCSYGPGRYDDSYEQGGRDYPYAYVRWTEQRNFEAVLGAMAGGQLAVDELITDRFAIADAPAAYEKVSNDPAALGVVLEYPQQVDRAPSVSIPAAKPAQPGQAVVGVVGAGNFSKVILTPALAKTDARIAYVADLKGDAAQHVAAKFGAAKAVTDYKLIMADPDVSAVVIAVGHNLHARFVIEALEAGKHAFVEKPLAMNEQELADVLAAAGAHRDRHVMVGFNRRFSPHTVKIRELLAGRSEPLAMNMTVNAGFIPPEHWIQDPVRGGGRIIGEGCHFIDLMVSLCGACVTHVAARQMGPGPATQDDKMSIVLSFADGSVGAVNYFANGPKSYPKEQLEVFSDGRVLKLDNFRLTRGYGFAGFKKLKTAQDKGHGAELAAFVKRVKEGGEPLIPLEQLANVTRASFAAVESARNGQMIKL
jgi:predicted dehydrogenase/NADPH:quinone reductase-like Zn-dependent oxidoreductase